MVIKEKEIVQILEGIINRLDETVFDTFMIDDNDQVGYKEGDYDADIDHDTDRIESALLIAENRIDEITQVLSEEIDNMRRLVDKIEEG